MNEEALFYSKEARLDVDWFVLPPVLGALFDVIVLLFMKYTSAGITLSFCFFALQSQVIA